MRHTILFFCLLLVLVLGSFFSSGEPVNVGVDVVERGKVSINREEISKSEREIEGLMSLKENNFILALSLGVFVLLVIIILIKEKFRKKKLLRRKIKKRKKKRKSRIRRKIKKRLKKKRRK